jgi:glycosyltransferase involved in cell wall biosynthesis
MKWFCAQIGAREHYAVPRVLRRDGRLGALYTDFWAGDFIRGAARRTNAKTLRSLAARFHPELEGAPVFSWNARSLACEIGLRHQKNDVYESFTNIGAAFARRVRDTLSANGDVDSNSLFFSYDTGALEALEWCREQGVKCVLDQMDPSRVEVKMILEEEKQWPNWALQSLNVPEEYFRRREREWALADCVMVNSDFCRRALLQQDVPAEKLAVVPLSFEGDPERREILKGQILLQKSGSKLRVLFLGQVILRKGIQYLIQAAKLLKDEPIQFDVVGPIGISGEALASAPANMVFHGRATRDQTANWYQQSDVFVLPTLSDGFALTQLEAMSYGLPVVATLSCGEVVTDGTDGFILPSRDADALAKALQRYVREPQLIRHQSHAALAKVGKFSLDNLAANLRTLEQRMTL